MNYKAENRKSPLVSVIVPVYNVAPYIEECIGSILEQTYSKLEIILVEDCSTDDSLSICQKYADLDRRIKLLHNEKNSGVSFSRNRAIDCATGEYVAMIDGDDWVEKDYIERMVNAIEETGADACACGYARRYEESDQIEYVWITKEKKLETGTKILDFSMSKSTPFVGYIWAKLYRKNLLDHLKLRFDTTISLCEDSLFNYTYFDCASNCVLLKECLYHYRIRQQSATRSATPDKIKTRICAFQKALEIAKKYPNSIFYYRVNATILDSALLYLSVSVSNDVELPGDEYQQIMHSAKNAYRQTKAKYISPKIMMFYFAFRISPKFAKLILRMKSGNHQ